MRKLKWDYDAWEDYLYWQKHDKNVLKKINSIIRDIQRTPFNGIGKPEALKGNLSGSWSRRINDEHRIVYIVENDDILIIACKGHYEKPRK